MTNRYFIVGSHCLYYTHENTKEFYEFLNRNVSLKYKYCNVYDEIF